MAKKKKYSKEYVQGYTTALHHSKLALQDMVAMIDKVEEEILGETDLTPNKQTNESEEI